MGTLIPETDSDGNDLRAIIAEAVANPERYAHHQNENITRSGKRLWISWTNRVVTDGGGSTHILSIGQDITAQKRAHDEESRTLRRVQALAHTLQHQAGTTEEYLDRALDDALDLTGSPIGYIALYDEESSRFTIHAWSKEVMGECAIENPRHCYGLNETGIWGEAVRQGRPIVLNDFERDHPLKRGYPEGHVHLRRFMTVPVASGDRIVAAVGVGNRSTPYTDADVAQLSLFMQAVWRSIEVRTAEEERRRFESRFQTVFETTATGMILLDRDGNLLHINRSALEIFGVRRQEVLGGDPRARDWQTIYPDGRPFPPTEHPSVHTLATGEPCDGVVMGIVRGDGETRWITVTTRPLLASGTGNVEGVVISFVDVTANEAAAAATREREEFYRAIFEKNRAVKLLFDPETGRIVDVNNAACEYYGYTREELLEMVIWQINTLPREKLLDEIARSREELQLVFRFQHRLANGSIRDVEVFSGPVQMHGRTLIHSIIQDITERVRAEQAVAELLREKELLLRETHHRVKNNMALVQSILSIEASNADDGRNTDVLTDAARRMQAMASLYDKLYRSDQHHQLDLAVYLPDLVQEIIKLLPSRLSVTAETQSDSILLPARSLSSLGIIVNELITNSIKHAFDQTGRVMGEQGRIGVTVRRTQSGAELVYRDNGPGLTDEAKTRSESTFGFTLIHAMVAQIDGTLTIDNAPSRGVEITVFVPVGEKTP